MAVIKHASGEMSSNTRPKTKLSTVTNECVERDCENSSAIKSRDAVLLQFALTKVPLERILVPKKKITEDFDVYGISRI